MFLLNAVDGCIPSDLGTGQTADIEEERRLLYVAMTRARDQLTIGVPLRFYVTQQTKRGDRHMFAARTRFISRDMLESFEVSHWAPPIIGQAAPTALGKVDVAAGLRGMWDAT